MIITIKGADFSSANIGTLSTYIISKSIGSGAAFDIPNFVDKNSSVNWVITLNEGYTFGTYSVTMGSEVITPTVVDNVMTITIAEVTGNVRIVVATINESGEEDDPVAPPVEPDEPEEPETPSTLLGGGILMAQQSFGKTDDTQAYNNKWDTSKTEYYVIDKFPVEPNTMYRLKNARAAYFLKEDGVTSVSAYGKARPNLAIVVSDWTFTTPSNCYFMSVAFKYSDVQPEAVELEKVVITEGETSEVLLNTLDVEVVEDVGLGASKYVTEANEGYYVVKNIPVDNQHKYRIPNGRATWFLNSSKAGKYRVNLRTEVTDYTFVPNTSDIVYVSTTFLATDVAISDAKIYITPYNKQYIKVS